MPYHPATMGDSLAERAGRKGGNETSASFLRLDFRGRHRAVPRRHRGRGRPVLAFLQGPAGLLAAAGLRAAGDDARARHRRRAGRRVCARTASLSADPGDPQARAATPSSRPRTRASTTTAGSTSPASRVPALLLVQNYGIGPPAAGRLHDHAAGREELPAHQRGELRAQDQGSAARAEDRAHLFEGQDPRALSQRNLSRLQRLRRRRRLAALLRQVGARADAGGSRLSRRPAEGAEQLSPVPPARARDRAPQLRARPHGRGQLPQARGRREVEEGAARRHAASDRRAYLRGGIFRRGSAPRPQRALRREEAVRGRAVGAHHARSETAVDGAQDADRRHGQVRRDARLSRRDPEGRHFGRLGREDRRREGLSPTCRGGSRSCSR